MNWITKTREKCGRPILWTLRIIFPVLLVAIAINLVPKIYNTLQAESFVSVPGRIIEAKIDTTAYKQDLITFVIPIYEYLVNGVRYESETYSYFNPYQVTHRFPLEKDPDLREKLNQKFGPNTETTVWYNPADPAESVLVKGREAFTEYWRDFLVLPAGIVASLVVWIVKPPERPIRRTSSRVFPSELSEEERKLMRRKGRKRY